MGLQHGGIEAQDQMNDAMTAEQQRELKNGLILVQFRRYWRFICIGLAVFSFLKMWLITGKSCLISQFLQLSVHKVRCSGRLKTNSDYVHLCIQYKCQYQLDNSDDER